MVDLKTATSSISDQIAHGLEPHDGGKSFSVIYPIRLSETTRNKPRLVSLYSAIRTKLPAKHPLAADDRCIMWQIKLLELLPRIHLGERTHLDSHRLFPLLTIGRCHSFGIRLWIHECGNRKIRWESGE